MPLTRPLRPRTQRPARFLPPRALIAVASALVLLLPAPKASAGVRWIVTGHGFGHGVGMSQYGAYGFAQHGKGYRFILAHYYRGTMLGDLNGSSTVRVLLAISPDDVRFSGATTACGAALEPEREYEAHRADSKVLLRGPDGRTLANCGSKLRATGGGRVEVAGSPYRGGLEVVPTRSDANALNAINALGVEGYVKGVVANESPASWPMAALRAQAVAARSYALTTKVGGNGFDLYNDTRSQVYGGIGTETARTNRAVKDTQGQVVRYHGEIAQTLFSACSGGHTESIQNVFFGEPVPYLVGVPDPYDGACPLHRWKLSFSAAEISARLGDYLKGRLEQITVTQRGTSPRIVWARLRGTGGVSTIRGDQLQLALGAYDRWMSFSKLVNGEVVGGSGEGEQAGGVGRLALTSTAAKVPAARASGFHSVRAKLWQSGRDLIFALRTIPRLPLASLDRLPRPGDDAPYACLSLSRGQRRGEQRICFGGRHGATRAVGLERLNAAGELVGSKTIEARVKRPEQGKLVVALDLVEPTAPLLPGRYRWRVLENSGGCQAEGCEETLPERGVRTFRLRPVRPVGCTGGGGGWVTNGPRDRRVLALTFDDGPSDYTPEFLHVLREEHAVGTFFELGQEIGGREATMRQILAEGSEIGNHTTHHQEYPSYSAIAPASTAIEAATHFRPCLFRPPGGGVDSAVIGAAAAAGMTTVTWDVDPADWTVPGAEAVYSRVVSAARPGSIILMHDGGGDRSGTLAALPRIIETLRARGYRFATVTELLGHQAIYRPYG